MTAIPPPQSGQSEVEWLRSQIESWQHVYCQVVTSKAEIVIENHQLRNDLNVAAYERDVLSQHVVQALSFVDGWSAGTMSFSNTLVAIRKVLTQRIDRPQPVSAHPYR